MNISPAVQLGPRPAKRPLGKHGGSVRYGPNVDVEASGSNNLEQWRKVSNPIFFDEPEIFAGSLTLLAACWPPLGMLRG